VAEVMRRFDEGGLVPTSIDLTILGSRPRLGGQRLDAMAQNIATMSGLDRARVSVKAATANLSGDEGAGRVISVSCLVSVVPR
jgi:2C-methyl-D-erythritol 2,4-cyclodiphosphate synthase